VLRGGRRIDEKAVVDTTGPELAQLIVGGALVKSEPAASFSPGGPLLRVGALTVKGNRGELALKGVDVVVRAGEVLGIAGVDGSGQRELFTAIAGLTKCLEGTIFLSGDEISSMPPSARIKEGLRLIPEDRHSEGVVEDWS